MLADMEAVIASEDHEGVIEYSKCIQPSDSVVHDVIHGLKCLQTQTVSLVALRYLRIR